MKFAPLPTVCKIQETLSTSGEFRRLMCQPFRMPKTFGESLPAAGSRATEQRLELLPVVDAYDAFAPHYGPYSQSRESYLRKVEAIIVSQTRTAASVLDVGAGDGVRSLRIAKAVGATRLVLVEPSAGMRADYPRDVEIWPCNVAEMPQHAPQFNLILCLWNVLGHIPTVEDRLLALSRLKRLVASGSAIFLDVNHRYNAAAYGWTRTLLRMLQDFFIPSNENGDVLVSWQVGARTLRTHGHVFTQSEMQNLFRSTGLTVLRRWVINYETGADCRLPFFGQLLYQLAAA